jgi:cystathionine beta-synthase
MPDKQSREKIQALQAFGSEVVVTPTAVVPEDPRSYYSVSRRVARETPNAFLANQYHNPDNPKAHFDATGPEIWRQMGEQIDVFVAGMGTGGTLTGVGRYLKSVNPDVKIVGVDPVGSLYYDYFKTGKLTEAYSYLLEGIGEDFLPSTMDLSVLDDVVRVSDRECFLMARDLVRKEGMFSGGSAGAAVAGALKWLRSHDKEGQQVLILLPDTGRQYLGKVYNDDWMTQNRMLGDASERGTVEDLLGASPRRAVISVPSSATVRQVADLMRKHDVSQVPVTDASGVIGIVTETSVLSHLVDRREGAGDAVLGLVENRYSMVDPETTLPVLSDMFTRVKIALVLDGKDVVNVLTRIDLVDYLAKTTRA